MSRFARSARPEPSEREALVTVDRMRKWKFDISCHLNMGRKGSTYMYRCLDNPRLSLRKTFDKKTRSSTTDYFVDKIACASIDDAVQRLNSAPRTAP